MLRSLSAARGATLALATLALALAPLFGTGTASAADRVVVGENFTNTG